MELKPCPFCGSDDIVVDSSESGLQEERWHWVYCRGCDAEGPTIIGITDDDGKSEAIKAWNTRHD